jgi:hypothetical protein
MEGLDAEDIERFEQGTDGKGFWGVDERISPVLAEWFVGFLC